MENTQPCKVGEFYSVFYSDFLLFLFHEQYNLFLPFKLKFHKIEIECVEKKKPSTDFHPCTNCHLPSSVILSQSNYSGKHFVAICVNCGFHSSNNICLEIESENILKPQPSPRPHRTLHNNVVARRGAYRRRHYWGCYHKDELYAT